MSECFSKQEFKFLGENITTTDVRVMQAFQEIRRLTTDVTSAREALIDKGKQYAQAADENEALRAKCAALERVRDAAIELRKCATATGWGPLDKALAACEKFSRNEGS